MANGWVGTRGLRSCSSSLSVYHWLYVDKHKIIDYVSMLNGVVLWSGKACDLHVDTSFKHVWTGVGLRFSLT